MSFFRTGGTLQLDAPSYITRTADQQLFAALQKGEFCYILTARQMGKSSLMVRAATRLSKEARVTTALLDLSSIGKNLTAEQWYAGILNRLGQLHFEGRPLDLEEELYDSFLASAQLGLGPYQRWVRTLEQVFLPRCPGPLVVFVDEIDSVLSLPFSSDEFFVGLRECYNRRADNPLFSRLSFCLLGVATPSDLIRDTRSTPFNIGQRIELRDFSLAEALPLAEGLLPLTGSRAQAEALVERVLYWTNGHPYLTQRLCQSLTEADSAPTSVDETCQKLFFFPGALERNDNLAFVHNRLLHGDSDPTGLLELYEKVLRGQRIADKGNSPQTALLRLSGIVTRDEQNVLHPRNRIYQRVFDRAWIKANLPDAELARQKRAFRKGLFRASGIGLAITTAFGAMLALTVRARNELDQTAFVANMGLASLVFNEGNVSRALQILEEYPQRDSYRQRSEWRLLWQLCNEATQHWVGLPKEPLALYPSPDGTTVSIIGSEGRLERRQRSDGALLASVSLLPEGAKLHKVAFSPDGNQVVLGINKGEVLLRDASTGQVAWQKNHHGEDGFSWRLAFSPTGNEIASGGFEGSVCLLDAKTEERKRLWKLCTSPVGALDFSPDHRFLAAGDDRGGIFLLDRATGQVLRTLSGPRSQIRTLRFSPDSKRLLAGCQEAEIWVWDVNSPSGRGRTLPTQHRKGCQTIAFSREGKYFATGSYDQTLVLWDAATETLLHRYRGPTNGIWRTDFMGNNALITLESSGEGRIWEVLSSPIAKAHDLLGLATTPDSRSVAVTTMPDNRLHLYETRNGQEVASFPGGHVRMDGKAAIPFGLFYAKDGQTLASAGSDGQVRLWAMPEHRLVKVLGEPTASPDPLMRVVLTGDARYAAALSATGKLRLWQCDTGKLLWERQGREQTGIAFSPDGTRLACSGKEKGQLELRSRQTGELVEASIPLSGSMEEIAFDPTDVRIGAALDDLRVVVYNWRTRRKEHQLFGHTGGTTQVIFSPDGKNLVTGGKDGTVKFWDMDTGRETITLSDSQKPILGLRFNPTGEILSITDDIMRTRQFQLPTQKEK